ncbi:MAG: GTPase HflX, partial [Chitinophagales bacterium]
MQRKFTFYQVIVYMSLIQKAEHQQEKAVLIGLIYQGQKEEQLTEYLDELAFLAETAGAITLKRFTQRLQSPHPRTFIGEGKLEEIRKYVEEKDVDLALFDDDLTGQQIFNIEKELK